MSKAQHRLSFSRAEIVLINSWMPVQQIVYHMLRVFVKAEQSAVGAYVNADAETLSNYHIKTLMLWACEQKPKTWWTDNSCLVGICVELLHTLALCLTKARCAHYFIDDCNLVDSSFDTETIASRMLSTNQASLSTWFVNNYIRRCSWMCPSNISRLLDDVSTRTKLQDAVSAFVDWRMRSNCMLIESWLLCRSHQYHITEKVSNYSLTVRSCVYWLNGLPNIDQRLTLYFTAVAFLHVSRQITTGAGLSEKLMGVLATVLGQQQTLADVHVSKTVSSLTEHISTQKPSSKVNTGQLVELLQQSAVEHLTAFRQIEARDFGSVATIVTTDFEAMYAYKRGDYQQCLQLSTQNVRTLLYGADSEWFSLFPEFIQLLDDDIVSLTALTLIVNPHCRKTNVIITLLTLSLCLLTECQLKLHQSSMSLMETVNYIELVQGNYPASEMLNNLILKLTKRKALMHITANMN